MSRRRWRTLAELALLATIIVHALLCPYTKVEESFSLQAIHDALVHREDFESYDHHEFPGVVPRTFLGPLVVAAFSSPVHAALETLGDFQTRLPSQIAARITLGFLCWLAFQRFNAASAFRFGEAVAGWAAVIWSLQFHLPFYLSRTLPNVFALCVILLGLAAWLRGSLQRALGFLTLATVIFRCDVVILLAPLTLQLLLSRQIGPLGVVITGLKWAIPSVLATVMVDSAIWGRWLWPEGQVLLFNTVDNRSSDWGEMPRLWYFTSALPRALSGAALLLPIAFLRDRTPPRDLLRRPSTALDTTALSYLLPGVAMVCLYSILPHKELRFIFPALPLFNLIAGVGMSRATRLVFGADVRVKKDEDGSGTANVQSGVFMRIVLLGVVSVSILSMVGTTFVAALASRENYPGGVALEALHQAIDGDTSIKQRTARVHIDAQAAMSGVSRFGQRKRGVLYSKQEQGVDFSKLDFLITATPSAHLDLFETLEAIEGFDGLSFGRFWRSDYDGGHRGIVTVSKREQLYVMARWFPPPVRDDLV